MKITFKNYIYRLVISIIVALLKVSPFLVHVYYYITSILMSHIFISILIGLSPLAIITFFIVIPYIYKKLIKSFIENTIYIILVAITWLFVIIPIMIYLNIDINIIVPPMTIILSFIISYELLNILNPRNIGNALYYCFCKKEMFMGLEDLPNNKQSFDINKLSNINMMNDNSSQGSSSEDNSSQSSSSGDENTTEINQRKRKGGNLLDDRLQKRGKTDNLIEKQTTTNLTEKSLKSCIRKNDPDLPKKKVRFTKSYTIKPYDPSKVTKGLMDPNYEKHTPKKGPASKLYYLGPPNKDFQPSYTKRTKEFDYSSRRTIESSKLIARNKQYLEYIKTNDSASVPTFRLKLISQEMKLMRLAGNPMPESPSSESSTTESSSSESSTTESSTTESPMPESPIAESPMAESPIAESPMPESPMAESSRAQMFADTMQESWQERRSRALLQSQEGESSTSDLTEEKPDPRWEKVKILSPAEKKLVRNPIESSQQDLTLKRSRLESPQEENSTSKKTKLDLAPEVVEYLTSRWAKIAPKPNPISLEPSQDKPVSIGSSRDKPIVIVPEENQPVSIVSEENQPVSIVSKENQPVSIGLSRDKPIVIRSEENESWNKSIPKKVWSKEQGGLISIDGPSLREKKRYLINAKERDRIASLNKNKSPRLLTKSDLLTLSKSEKDIINAMTKEQFKCIEKESIQSIHELIQNLEKVKIFGQEKVVTKRSLDTDITTSETSIYWQDHSKSINIVQNAENNLLLDSFNPVTTLNLEQQAEVFNLPYPFLDLDRACLEYKDKILSNVYPPTSFTFRHEPDVTKPWLDTYYVKPYDILIPIVEDSEVSDEVVESFKFSKSLYNSNCRHISMWCAHWFDILRQCPELVATFPWNTFHNIWLESDTHIKDGVSAAYVLENARAMVADHRAKCWAALVEVYATEDGWNDYDLYDSVYNLEKVTLRDLGIHDISGDVDTTCFHNLLKHLVGTNFSVDENIDDSMIFKLKFKDVNFHEF